MESSKSHKKKEVTLSIKAIKPENANRRLEYLNLAIPEVTHEVITTLPDGQRFIRNCNFLEGKNIKHIWHSASPLEANQQLNTVIDMIINLSENLRKADNDIKEKISKLRPDSDPEDLKKLLGNISKNQTFMKNQVEELRQRVEKTLHKADKFPSKKDIQNFTNEIKQVVAIPTEIDKKLLALVTSQEQVLRKQEQLLEEKAESDSKNLAKILDRVKTLTNALIGEQPEDQLYGTE